MKRVMTIEEALQWAYRDELPKASASRGGWSPPTLAAGSDTLNRFRVYGTMIDASPNAHGVLPAMGADDEPRPDALRLSAAVQHLDALGLVLPETWDPFEDIANPEVKPLAGRAAQRALNDLMPRDEKGWRRMLRRPSAIIIHQAVMRSAPDWRCDPMQVRYECNAKGGPKWFVRQVFVGERGMPFEVELDGFDPRRRMPRPGAYRKPYLDPDPYLCACARAEYEVWVDAMAILADWLADALDSIAVVPSCRPARPWVEGMPGIRVLRDLTPPPAVLNKGRRRGLRAT